MAQAQAAILGGHSLHLSEGPIDLVIRAWGPPAEVRAAYRQARAAFDGLLGRLVSDLDLLRRPVGDHSAIPAGPVALRMVQAVQLYRHLYITPMAAVAGAVADHMLAAAVQGRELERALVNDGGDIALHLCAGQAMRLGMADRIHRHPAFDGVIEVEAKDPVRGVATSGQGGRSFSLGIADAVTVLAADAAAADAAATVIANAVDVHHPAIERRPARALDPDSDLGDLPVTVAVGSLDDRSIAAALDGGAVVAGQLYDRGLIAAAALRLRGSCRLVGAPGQRLFRLPQPASA